MNDRLTRILKIVALALGAAFVASAVYGKFIGGTAPGDMPYHAGNTLFEDGYYERAAAAYRQALDEDPNHVHALRGLARSLHKAGRHEEALLIYEEAIAAEPGFGATYANRGILLDMLGRHAAALADYERALELDPELADGPNWLTRFLRNQPEAPPGIDDRARYLRAELMKPEGERLLRVPEIDAAQRPYQQ